MQPLTFGSLFAGIGGDASIAIFGGNFALRHLQNAVVMLQLFVSKRNRICVLIAHPGIVSNASRKEVISC